MDTSQYLIKFSNLPARLELNKEKLFLAPGIELEPLETGTELAEQKQQFSSSGWYMLNGTTEISSWDEAHEIRNNLKAFGDAYVEPDIVHPFNYRNKEDDLSCDEKTYIPEWTPLPAANEFCWYLDDNKTQLRLARLPDQQTNKVRIAHLDTGYDPDHVSKPKYLRTDLQNNFTKGETGNSAVDHETTGPLRQFGHGTGTLAILAGNHVTRPGYNDYTGGAPFSEIVPIRIASSVVLFRTHAFWKAVRYALNCKCDVISMSMGGLASKLWAEVVNEAYMAGTIMVTAAGNNFKGLPVRKMVYPARFERVIAACGVTYGNKAYYDTSLPIDVMQGCWGPKRLMHWAMAAYTPNVPWALFGCQGAYRKTGGGTSAATAQIAAAAALVSEKYKDQAFSHQWQRAEAVRQALFLTGNTRGIDFEKVGKGVVQAVDALDKQLTIPASPAPEAKVRFPLLTLLFGARLKMDKTENEMLEVEMAQIHELIPEIKTILENIDETSEEELNSLSEKDLATIKQALLKSELPSKQLKSTLS